MTKKTIYFLFIFIVSSFFGFHVSAKVWEFEGKKYFVNLQDPNVNYYPEIITLFKAALLRHSLISGELKECERVIDIPVGTAKGNHSYGGICTLEQGGKEIRFMICADVMVGHQVVKFGGMLSDVKLAQFVAMNCYGG